MTEDTPKQTYAHYNKYDKSESHGIARVMLRSCPWRYTLSALCRIVCLIRAISLLVSIAISTRRNVLVSGIHPWLRRAWKVSVTGSLRLIALFQHSRVIARRGLIP